MVKNNVKIAYLGRDEDNFKTEGDFIVANPLNLALSDIKNKITTALNGGMDFDPSSIGVPDLVEDGEHEITAITFTRNKPTVDFDVTHVIENIEYDNALEDFEDVDTEAIRKNAFREGFKAGQHHHPNINVIQLIIRGVADRIQTCDNLDEDSEQEEIEEVGNFRRGAIAGAAAMIKILNDDDSVDVATIHAAIDRAFADSNCETEDMTEAIQTATNAVMEVCRINPQEKYVSIVLNERQAFVTLASLTYAFAGVEGTNDTLLDQQGEDEGQDIIRANNVPGSPLLDGEDEPIKKKLMEIFPKWA